jgi:hypothetical protein
MLASEADVLRTLRAGTYTLEQLYQLCEQRALVARDGGHDPVPDHAGDTAVSAPRTRRAAGPAPPRARRIAGAAAG